jgi:predicted ATP-dependent serine protease
VVQCEMSSFRKATKVSNGQPVATEGRKSGVKPWVNGLSLVSSGIRELDEVLGGGHVVGSLCLIHEDTYSNYSDTILLYSMAEAISQNHKTLLVVRDTNEAKALISALPFNMNKGSLSLDKKNTVRTAEEEEDDKKRHLKIAWQYGKYIKGKVQLWR